MYDLASEKRANLLSSLVRAFSSGKRQQVDGASVDIYGEGGLLAQIWHKGRKLQTNVRGCN